MRTTIIKFGLILHLGALGTAYAAANGSGQSLGQAANDPTASLMNVQIEEIYTGAFHGLDNEDGNSIRLRTAVPFSTGKFDHIARLTVPYITDSPSGERGLGDTVLFDLIVFDQSWGRWGVGPVALLPSAADKAIGQEKWAIGPALGFVAAQPGLLLGLFNQNLFSFAGDDDRDEVDISIVQPIFSYSLPHQWSINTSEMNFTYDWSENAWTVLPLGAKLAKLLSFGGQKVQISGAYEYNFADDHVGPEWKVNFTAKFLFPL